MKECCKTSKEKSHSFLSGLIFGLLPHSVCLGFILLTVIGATAMTGIFKKLLLVPFFFETLIGLSLIFATISAVLYLNKNNLLSLVGLSRKWRYLLILYGTTLGVNLLFFMVVFPYIANKSFSGNKPFVLSQRTNLASLTLEVTIPCSGHAPLVIDELKKLVGVESVTFKIPNLFEVSYRPQAVSPEQILSLEVFKSFKATVQK